MTHFSTSGHALTGRTRYAMGGIWPFRKPRLQVEETYRSTAMETQTFSCITDERTRWRFAAKRDLAFLSSLYSASSIWDDAPKTTPFSEFKMRDLVDAEAREIWLSEQEIDRLLSVCNADYQRLFILVAVDTGMRSSEIMNLRWDEVDLKQGFIYLGNRDKRRTKGKRGRVIPMTARVSDTLRDTPGSQRGAWVFANPKTGAPYTTLKTFWKRATADAGLEGVRIHDLRHTFGSRSNHAGIDNITLMSVMGHRSETMLKRYAHPSHDSLRKAVDKLDRHS